jgi:hypothetical protein
MQTRWRVRDAWGKWRIHEKLLCPDCLRSMDVDLDWWKRIK